MNRRYDAVPMGQTFQLEVPCTFECLRQAARDTAWFLEQQGLSKSEVHAWELAITEAGNNAVQHAAPESRDVPVSILAFVSPTQVEIHVVDHTRGFDLPEQFEVPDPEAESGRGLFLIHASVDDVHYFRGPLENRLILRKACRVGLSAGAASADPALEINDLTRRLSENERTIDSLTEEVSCCYESLSAIFRFGPEAGKARATEAAIRPLLRELMNVVEADDYVLRLNSGPDGRLPLFDTSRDQGSPGIPPLNLAQASGEPGVELDACLRRHDVWFDSARPLADNDPLRLLGPDAIGLTHPFFRNETLAGVLTLSRSAQRPPFNAGQVSIVHTLADFVALQVANAKVHQETLHAELIGKELEIATKIQRCLLPKISFRRSSVSIDGSCESARQVGGDFFDILPWGEECVLMVIADVMGKGVPAAMLAATVRSQIRAMAEWSIRPGDLLSQLNRRMHADLESVEMFVTLQLVFADISSRKAKVASAGHCSVLLARPGDGAIEEIAPDGIPLGIHGDKGYHEVEFSWTPGSRILLFTDGITEARSPQGELFGLGRLKHWLAETTSRRQTADQLKAGLTEHVRSFEGSAQVADDQTFVILADHGPQPPT